LTFLNNNKAVKLINNKAHSVLKEMTNKSITQCTHVKNLISMQPGLIIYSVKKKKNMNSRAAVTTARGHY